MCSILGILTSDGDDARSLRTRALEMSRKQRHRGPDWSGVWASERVMLVHERLVPLPDSGRRLPLVLDGAAPHSYRRYVCSACQSNEPFTASGGDEARVQTHEFEGRGTSLRRDEGGRQL